MGFIKEFKDFALKGNVVDLAIGVIIGAAFGKIVSSLIENVITPLMLNPILEAANLKDIEQLVLEGTAVKYGLFLSALINFIIVALVLFLIIKAINSAKKKEEAPAAPAGPTQEQLLSEIRDLLKK